MKKRWSDIRKGDRLELGGREWTVLKIDAGKKKAAVKIRHKSNVVRDTVKLADKVHLAEKPEPRKQQRREVAKPPKQKKRPPAPADGNPWETQQDRIEKKMDQILGARLIGEATDADAGYYVPLPDVSTIAAHLLIFHGGIPETPVIGDEGAMLSSHARMHALAESGNGTLEVNHWHTEKRPTTGKKKGKK